MTKDKLWSNRIRDFQESGLTRKEWCYQNQIPLSTLSYWIRKLNPDRPSFEEHQEPIFARLPSESELSKVSCDHAPVTFFLNSIRIEISAGCPAELLSSLVSILKPYA
ncbi:IS66 family insertion sequence element accessory protein TnpA [[Clostridium] scindens]|uniref:IS66 family insertion sequence element accessory protein TnpA n=1 Tax=Clostridium scindens (strain JCM 10418 / VPI 12708) TaxID=29347 RepID=UPI003A7F1495